MTKITCAFVHQSRGSYWIPEKFYHLTVFVSQRLPAESAGPCRLSLLSLVDKPFAALGHPRVSTGAAAISTARSSTLPSPSLMRTLAIRDKIFMENSRYPIKEEALRQSPLLDHEDAKAVASRYIEHYKGYLLDSGKILSSGRFRLSKTSCEIPGRCRLALLSLTEKRLHGGRSPESLNRRFPFARARSSNASSPYPMRTLAIRDKIIMENSRYP